MKQPSSSNPGELTPEARLATWEGVANPMVMEFICGMSTRTTTTRLATDTMIHGTSLARSAFVRTRRFLFQDSSYQLRRIDPVRDIFLTTEMMLPTPRLPRVHGVSYLTPISLPLQKVASTFSNRDYDRFGNLNQVSSGPLNLRFLPDLREFTMMCPLPYTDAEPIHRYLQPSTSPSSSGGSRYLTPLRVVDNPSETSNTVSQSSKYGGLILGGPWFGFRYYVETGRVCFTSLARHEALEMALAGEWSGAGSPKMVVRLWVVRRGEESVMKNEPHHKWQEGEADLAVDEDKTGKAGFSEAMDDGLPDMSFRRNGNTAQMDS
ncbi:hypothetical protein FALBO_15935 [Fusarium albosuccineum]|uniref:Uncharacterized protein n=1 Tax=Fusarium albosuccineum TaxID=1237068 RepID=A0A8H4KQI6_9HYPO|nr:hypothetical protein FALBO_15935 [Fusarium albosuccineum]